VRALWLSFLYAVGHATGLPDLNEIFGFIGGGAGA